MKFPCTGFPFGKEVEVELDFQGDIEISMDIEEFGCCSSTVCERSIWFTKEEARAFAEHLLKLCE